MIAPTLHPQDPAQHFRARALTAIDAEDLREIRLESLRYYGRIFDNYHATEAAKPIDYWVEQASETPSRCFFGLFNNNNDMIAVMAARKWEKCPDGRTALWYGNYIVPQYRGLGFSADLYQCRLDWCQTHRYDKAIAFVQDDIGRSAEILKKLGATKTHSEKISFHGGPAALWHWYEIDLVNVPKKQAQPQRCPRVISPFTNG
jgi:RimJ/RimL family protein N-acetyltransferase